MTPTEQVAVLSLVKSFAIYILSLDIGSRAEGDASLPFEPYQMCTRPPYFEYRWLIETLRNMPAFMIQQGRLAESSIGIVVDTVHVGDRLLRNGTFDAKL